MPHQRSAASRLAEIVQVFGGALLCDAAGLGKTYVALAIASRFRDVVVTAPATLLEQWRSSSAHVASPVSCLSHESLSRNRAPGPADLIIVDEAHRFRNPGTKRYDALARSIGTARVLLLTATPVVNSPRDLAHLLRLFLRDDALAMLGVPSIDASVDDRGSPGLAEAIAPLLVARSSHAAGLAPASLPVAADAPVLEHAPLRDRALTRVLARMDRLRFPAFEERPYRQVMALHLRYRLSSSVPACLETIDRHRAYLRRAIDAAGRGEMLGRAAARSLFGADPDPQLSLDGLWTGTPRPVPARRLRLELDRLNRVRGALLTDRGRNPKLGALQRILADRRGRKTIVFTNAVATAMEIAERLGWHSVAVVTGRGARIAAGRIPVDTALELFAPLARGAGPAQASTPVCTLIATDLVSEGLNLQDADGVVHYDLPWTPLRLQQRTGRITRLGSTHAQVGVWWFRPPAPLERHLRLAARIERKAAYQRSLGVPTSSRVGVAQLPGDALERRERVAAGAAGAAGTTGARPCYAVVRGPAAAVVALRWTFSQRQVPEVVAFRETTPRQVERLSAICSLLSTLRGPASNSAVPPPWLAACLRDLIGRRLRGCTRLPDGDQQKHLARAVVRRAKTDRIARQPEAIEILDRVLERIAGGLVAGAHRELTDLLAAEAKPELLAAWSMRWDRLAPDPPLVVVDAALIGDGTG